MAKKTPPTYLSPAIAIDAALAQPRRANTIFDHAIEQFGDAEVAMAMTDRIVAADTAPETVECLLPMLMLVELNPSVLTRLADKAFAACVADDPLGSMLIISLAMAGAIPDREFVDELPDAVRDLIADALTAMQAEIGPVDPDAGDLLSQARQVFIEAGAPAEDPMMRMIRELATRQATQPKPAAKQTSKPAAGMQRH